MCWIVSISKIRITVILLWFYYDFISDLECSKINDGVNLVAKSAIMCCKKSSCKVNINWLELVFFFFCRVVSRSKTCPYPLAIIDCRRFYSSLYIYIYSKQRKWNTANTFKTEKMRMGIMKIVATFRIHSSIINILKCAEAVCVCRFYSFIHSLNFPC